MVNFSVILFSSKNAIIIQLNKIESPLVANIVFSM